MKIDAISTHEACTIIQHLPLHGKWRATRMGADVEIVRLSTATGNQIHYSVTIERTLVVTARAQTVKAAVDDINSIIHGRTPVALAGRAVRDPNHTGTPHLVRQRHKHGATESDSLWKEGA
jgi:hypothetical protein